MDGQEGASGQVGVTHSPLGPETPDKQLLTATPGPESESSLFLGPAALSQASLSSQLLEPLRYP